MHLIRFSAIDDDVTAEQMAETIIATVDKVLEIQNRGFQKGVIKIHYNGVLTEKYFAVIEEVKKARPNVTSLLKVRYTPFSEWKTQIISSQEEIMLRDNNTFVEQMIAEALATSKIILQVRQGSDQDQNNKALTMLQNSGLKHWRILPYDPDDDNELDRLANGLKKGPLPDNIKKPGRESTEYSYYVKSDASPIVETGIFQNGKEISAREDTADYNRYYTARAKIVDKLT